MKNKKRGRIIQLGWQREPNVGLTRDEIERFKRVSIYDGCFIAVYLAFLAGFFITGYGKELNFSSFQLGIIFGSFFLSQFIGPFGVWILDQLFGRKFSAVNSRRFSTLLMGFLAFATFFDAVFWSFSFFWIIVTIQAILASVNTILCCGWMDSVIPDEERHSFSIKRTTIATIVSVITLVTAGFLLDILPKPFNFQLSAGIASLAGFISSILMNLQPEGICKYARQLKLASTYGFIFSDLRFKNLSRFLMTFYPGFLMIDNFLFLHSIENLCVSFLICGLCAAVGQLSSLYFTVRWNYLASKFGAKNSLIISCIAAGILVPISVLIATKQVQFPIFLVMLIHYGCGAAVNSLFLNMAFDLTTPEEREKVSAGLGLVIGISSAPMIVLGGLALDILKNVNLPTIIGIELTPFHVMTIAGSACILFSIVYLVKVFEVRPIPFRKMLRHIIPTLFFFWKKPNFAEETEKSDHK